MNKYVELPKEHITFYGDTEEEKKKNEIIFDLSLEVDRLNNIIDEIESILYSENDNVNKLIFIQETLDKIKKDK